MKSVNTFALHPEPWIHTHLSSQSLSRGLSWGTATPAEHHEGQEVPVVQKQGVLLPTLCAGEQQGQRQHGQSPHQWHTARQHTGHRQVTGSSRGLRQGKRWGRSRVCQGGPIRSRRKQDQRQGYSTGPKPIEEAELKTRLENAGTSHPRAQPGDEVPAAHGEPRAESELQSSISPVLQPRASKSSCALATLWVRAPGGAAQAV